MNADADLKLRSDLADWLYERIEGEEINHCWHDFYGAFDEIRAAHPELSQTLFAMESAATSASALNADAAFIVGYQVGRDPASYLFAPEPTKGEAQPSNAHQQSTP